MRTERINILLSPEERAAVDALAKRADVNTSELVRRALAAYDPDVNRDELQTLAGELSIAVERMEKTLDKKIAEIERLRKLMADKDGLRKLAVADLEARDEARPLSPLGESAQSKDE